MNSRFWKLGLMAMVLAASLALAACGGGGSSSSSEASTSESSEESTTAGGEETSGSEGEETASSGEPIKIGAAIDESSFMAPTDDPALAGAELEAKKINAEGGVDGREIVFTKGNTAAEPGKNKSVAEEQLGKGSEILWVT